jgi:hypothetical protein
MSASAVLFGSLPATPSGSDYQAYCADQLDITQAVGATINREDST